MIRTLTGFDLGRIFIDRLGKQARVRGYNPESSKQLRLEHVIDALSSGRPSTVTPAVEQVILKTVLKDRNGREKISSHSS